METNERNMEYASGGQYGRQVGSETFNRAQGQGESTFSQMKSTVADKLHAAADSLHQTAGRGTEETQFTRFGHQAADWLDRSADYVSRMEPRVDKAIMAFMRQCDLIARFLKYGKCQCLSLDSCF